MPQMNYIYIHLAASLGLRDLSSPTRDWTQVTAVKALSSNHQTTRELQVLSFNELDIKKLNMWNVKTALISNG